MAPQDHAPTPAAHRTSQPVRGPGVKTKIDFKYNSAVARTRAVSVPSPTLDSVSSKNPRRLQGATTGARNRPMQVAIFSAGRSASCTARSRPRCVLHRIRRCRALTIWWHSHCGLLLHSFAAIMRTQPKNPGSYKWLSAILALGALALGVGMLYWAREVLIPISLAILIALILAPIVTLLRRWGIGHTVSVYPDRRVRLPPHWRHGNPGRYRSGKVRQ